MFIVLIFFTVVFFIYIDSYPDSGISANVTPASIENELNIPRTMSLNELVSSDLGDIA